MGDFDAVCQEIIVLSDVFYKQRFRECFVEHLLIKIEHLIELSKSQHVDICVRQKLQLKLLEPIMFHLRGSLTFTAKCTTMRYLVKILNLTLINDVNLFFHLYMLIFSQILDKGDFSYKICEELKLAAFETGSLLILNSHKMILEQVLKPEFGEKYSMGIFLAMQVAKKEKCIQLRLKALDFLLHASLHEANISYNQGIYKNIGDVFMLYLPGIVGPLQEIILRDETQNHLITVKALTCWGHVICLVLNDMSPCEKKQSDCKTIRQWIQSCADFKEEEKIISDYSKILCEKKRTKAWLKAASETLIPIILRMTEVKKHSNFKCRLELLKVMIKLHQHCKINLVQSLSAILEVLICSTVDENDKIRSVSKEYIDNMMKKQSFDQRNSMLMIKKNFFSLINKLPGVLHCGDEKLILSHLKSLSGYFKILCENKNLHQIITFLPTLKKLSNVIEMAFKMQYCSEISELEFSSSGAKNMDRDRAWAKVWKRFEHFRDDSIRCELEGICYSLGEHGCAETTLDYLLDTFYKENSRRNEILLILNQIILGMKQMNDSLINQILDFYLDPENLFSAVQVDEGGCKNSESVHSNIIQVALIMEGINNLVTNIGEKFENYVQKTLYTVIEQMGSSYSIISSEAFKAAKTCAKVCGYEGNVNLLIRKNIDYLSFHTKKKLRRNDYGVFDVLTVLINSSSIEDVSDVEEVMNVVLLNSNWKNFNSPFVIPYLRMFQTFVGRVKMWTRECEGEKRSKENAQKTENDSLEKNHIKQLLEDVQKREEVKNEEEEKEEEEEEEEKYEEEGTANGADPCKIDGNKMSEEDLPKYVSLTVSISNHCIHFLSSKDKNKKVLAVEILNESLSVLRVWENQVLPLVHKIWAPLMARFEEISDPLLIRASFGLLCTLASTSGHFIRSRTLRSVLPALLAILSKEAPKTKLKNKAFSSHYFTQSFKLQRDLLENLARFTIDVQLFEKHTDCVIESAIPYLSSSQDEQLQEKCRLLMSRIKLYDPYSVWLKLHGLKNESEFSKNALIVLS